MKRAMQSCMTLVAIAGLMAGCNLQEKTYPTPQGKGGAARAGTAADAGSESLRLIDRNAPAPAPRAEAPKAAPAPTPAAAPAPMPAPGLVRTAMYFPTGDASTSAIFLERTAPGEVVAGQEFCYDYKVTNLTKNTLTSVVLRDRCAEGFTMTSSTPQSMSPARDLSWNLGDLKPGESKVVKVCGKATGVGKLESCAQVSYASMLCIETSVVQPALAVTLTMQPEALVCDTIMSKVCVKNNGTGVARMAKISYPLPAGLTTADGKNSFTVDVGDLGAGQERCFDVALKASKGGQYSATADAMADMGLSAKSGAATTNVRTPSVAITADCPKGPVIAGRSGRDVTFRFTVTNPGDAPSANTVVSAMLPAGAAFGSADNGGQNAGGRVNWNLGTLDAKATRTVSFTVKSGAAGSLATSATVNGACNTTATANCTVSVEGLPDIGTTVTDDDGVVEVGANHTYRVEVKNQGQVNLTNVKMVVKIPEGMSFVSSADGKAITGAVEFSFGTLAPGATKASSFVVKSSKAGELLVIGETTCTEIKTPVRDDELTNFVGN